MKSKIEFEECLKDSPKFRMFLDSEEASIDHLEQKLEKALKMCTISVDSGKEYVKNQSAFATSLWDLQTHFQENKSAHNALGKIIHCLQEMNKFHTILLDQASRTILKNITSFIKNDIKEVKEYKNLFAKVSESFDKALAQNAQANKNRSSEVTEAVNILSATTSCFRHTSLDYVNMLTMLQSKKIPEILSTLLSYYQACNTFYHQGSDLCTDFEQFFKGLSDEITTMRTDSCQLEKAMQNRHMSVSAFVDDLVTITPANSTAASSTHSTNVNQFEGYLFKRTSKGFKTWNRRWFYLCDNQLLYRKRGDNDTPTVMEEDLRICTVRPVNDSDRRFCFEVISPTKSHILQADSAELMNVWISALHKSIFAAIQYNRNELKIDSELPLPGAGHAKKISWEQFLKIPGNSRCCDCGNTEPRWASINLGITLCIACSGVHRSLGVHHSKVRSLTLDQWEPEIVKVMMELGNKVVNKVYEARYKEYDEDDSNDRMQRATDECDISVREAWIKAKYVDKRFVLPLLNANCIQRKRSNEKINDDEEDGATAGSETTGEDGAGNESPISHHIRSANTSSVGAKRWSVRRVRRRPNSRNRSTFVVSTNSNSAVGEEDATSSQSETSAGSLLIVGKELTGEPLQTEEFELVSSDQESTGGEDNNVLEEEEDISTLNPNLLLYKASAAHNLPVMCHAMALCAQKNWTNENDLKRSALHQAVLSGSVMACEYLLLNGCHIDINDVNGYTPLHLATEKGCTAQAYLLLKHRAKHDIIAHNGKKPIDIAVEQANADIVTLLRLTRLNEEIGIEEQNTGEGDTYNDVMKDFSRYAVNQPQRLLRNSKTDQNETDT